MSVCVTREEFDLFFFSPYTWTVIDQCLLSTSIFLVLTVMIFYY